MHKFYTDELALIPSGILMEIHCHITEICEPPMSSSLFSVIFSWVSKVLLFLFLTTINSPNLYAMWLIYVPPKVKINYKNRLSFPFNYPRHPRIWRLPALCHLPVLLSLAQGFRRCRLLFAEPVHQPGPECSLHIQQSCLLSHSHSWTAAPDR